LKKKKWGGREKTTNRVKRTRDNKIFGKKGEEVKGTAGEYQKGSRWSKARKPGENKSGSIAPVLRKNCEAKIDGG